MLKLLTKGSRMSQLYLEYLKHRGNENQDSTAVAAILASIKSIIQADQALGKDFSAPVQKKRFQQYQRNLSSLNSSVDPSAGA